jgi:hypothetical protein
MDKISINIWINEQRYQQLCKAGLENMAKEVLAGMKVLQVFCNEKQKNELLKNILRLNMISLLQKVLNYYL